MDKLSNKKTAIVYDKWLSTLGGGEVVACNIAKALYNSGYKTTFICGGLVDTKIIREKLGIDLSKIEFIEIWNDEEKINNLTKDKDIFVNASYMDYTVGKAKKSYFYTSFPTKSNNNLKGIILNDIVLPLASKYIKPVEFSNQPTNVKEEHGHILYQIDKNIEVKFPYLEPKKQYLCKFSIYYPLVSKYDLEKTSYEITNCTTDDKIVKFDHLHNAIHYEIKLTPKSKTCNLKISFKNEIDKAFLINPRIVTFAPLDKRIIKLFQAKLINRLRAGYFRNIQKRMGSFNTVFANSNYTAKWIKKYWNCDSKVLYPPVELIKPNSSVKKLNHICSVGRFFTLGHGKKQEIMIEAFKQMCDSGLKNWELHLAGGLGNEATSLEFMSKLKIMSKGYPIFFHINCSRKEIEDIYLSSKIYWHATGFGENKNKEPIKFEHFGIAPIEAMSAGCIPILLNGGGLPDTIDSVDLDPNLHLFNTISGLIDNTNYQITHYKSQSQKINKIYSKLVQNYDDKVFRKKFIKLIK